MPCGVILGPWWPLGVPKGPKAPESLILVTFWAPFGSLGEHFWGHFGAQFLNRRDYVDLLVPFFRSRKMERTRGSPWGWGHAIRPRRRMFREGRPSSLRLHFGLHFGVILGANFATMLFLGRHGGQNRLRKERLKGACFLEPDRPRIRVSKSYTSHTCTR